MSEGSLPPLGPFKAASFPSRLARRVFGRLRRRRKDADRPDAAEHAEDVPTTPADALDRVAAELRSYADAHALTFDRAERLSERAARLEQEGTPSESVRNQAERATEEIRAGLAGLRAKFSGQGKAAFDQEVERRYPAFKPQTGSS